MPKPKSDLTDAERYEAKRAAAAAESRRQSEAGRDIGVVPNIANVRRRARCRKSLRFFCETYNRSAFNLAWSDDHLRVMERIEEAATHGALYALAMARGSGKTTICRMAALWAMSYSLCRYVFVIGATDAKAVDTLESLKMMIRFGQPYGEDFPEISFAVSELKGSSRKVGGQTSQGEPTLMEWAGDRLVLPSVMPPANWPKTWALRSDGKVPTSGAVVSTSGLTGEGIRGSLLTLSTGEMIRPDLVLLDDPQTPGSSRSRTQNVTREQLVSADVLGMAGPGKSISAIMPCTVISPGDFIDKILDRSKHPLWRGERCGMMRSMPKNLAAWDGYFEVYRHCAQMEPPDFTEANAYYVEHRKALEEGAEASWEERKLPGDVSAIQHAMNLYCRDRRAFMAEYMNLPEPIEVAGQLDDLDADEIAAKFNRVPRGVVPMGCTRLTGGIDVQSEVAYWCVVAWTEGFSGSVVDYGTFPKQGRSYFAARDVRPSFSEKWPGQGESPRVFAGVRETINAVVGRTYSQDGGGELRMSLCLVDSSKWTKEVTQCCRQSAFSALVRPSKGWGGLTSVMANWQVKEGERPGDNWRDKPNTEGGHGRLIQMDVNYWKSFVARGLLTPEMGAGCINLFGDNAEMHQLFAEHCTAECRTVPLRRTGGDQREVEVWQLRPGRPDNHWWDALVMATVAASVNGVKWDAGAAVGEPAKPRTPRQRVKLSDLMRDKAKKRGETGEFSGGGYGDVW